METINLITAVSVWSIYVFLEWLVKPVREAKIYNSTVVAGLENQTL
jgi:hypothetical protein